VTDERGVTSDLLISYFLGALLEPNCRI